MYGAFCAFSQQRIVSFVDGKVRCVNECELFSSSGAETNDLTTNEETKRVVI